MRKKVDEIENDDYRAKFFKIITDNSMSNSGNLSICQLKKKKVISFQISFNFFLFLFKEKKLEVIFDLDKLRLVIFLNEKENKIFYEEKLNPDEVKQFNYDNFLKDIQNKPFIFELMKEKITTKIKFAFYQKISYFEKQKILISKYQQFFSNSLEFIENTKKFLKTNIKQFEEFTSYETKTKDFFNQCFKLLNNETYFFLIDQKPEYNFELKNQNKHFQTKQKDYCLLEDASKGHLIKINIEYNNNPFKLSITKDKELELILLYNNTNDIMLKLNNLQIIFKSNFKFIGNISSDKEYFGIEQANKYTYIGNYKNDFFDGQGIQITPYFIFKGHFTKGSKTDQNALVIFEGNKQIYTGGINKNELTGFGKLNITNDKVIESNFNKGELEGKTKFVFSNGDTFTGEMKNGNFKDEWIYTNKSRKKQMKAQYNNIDNITYSY